MLNLRKGLVLSYLRNVKLNHEKMYISQMWFKKGAPLSCDV